MIDEIIIISYTYFFCHYIYSLLRKLKLAPDQHINSFPVMALYIFSWKGTWQRLLYIIYLIKYNKNIFWAYFFKNVDLRINKIFILLL